MLQLICTPATVVVAVAALHAAEPKVPPHCPLSNAAATATATATTAAAAATRCCCCAFTAAAAVLLVARCFN